MIVLILGKTKMNDGICIGGYLTSERRSVRLIPQGRHNNPLDDDHQIGDLWEIDFHRPAQIVDPHTEDIIVTRSRFVRHVTDIRNFITEHMTPYNGPVTGLYGGLIRFTGNGSGYISHNVGVPNYSTCFWIPDRHLNCSQEGNKKYYLYNNNLRQLKFIYKGMQESVNRIEAGTLVRMSLARWWAPEDADIEERCYVQLSGWF